MRNRTREFKENDLVRTLPNTKDPDFNENIGGWTGEVEEIELGDNGVWLYKIRWSEKTLSKAGNRYIEKCEAENLHYEVIYLEEKELELLDSKPPTLPP